MVKRGKIWAQAETGPYQVRKGERSLDRRQVGHLGERLGQRDCALRPAFADPVLSKAVVRNGANGEDGETRHELIPGGIASGVKKSERIKGKRLLDRGQVGHLREGLGELDSGLGVDLVDGEAVGDKAHA